MRGKWISVLGGCALTLSLAACGDEVPPQPTDKQKAARQDVLPVMGPERRILAFGDSLFAGYNVARDESYPARLEAALRIKGINARVTNAGVSGDTTAAGLQRLAFTLDSQKLPPELVIVELGGNDLLRGLSPEQTRTNLSAILAELKKRGIPAILMGMRAPPNMGPDFVKGFDGIYPALAREYGVRLVPFFLEPIYDKPELIQDDHIHPTARGIEELVAATSGAVTEALPAPSS